MRKISRYIKPESMSYLQNRHITGKNIGSLLLTIFLWLYAVLQEHMTLSTAIVITIAFILMAKQNSKLLATLTLISLIGVFYLHVEYRDIALGVFASVLFIGTVIIVGAPKRTVHSYAMGHSVDSCDGGGGDGS